MSVNISQETTVRDDDIGQAMLAAERAFIEAQPDAKRTHLRGAGGQTLECREQ